MKNKDLIRRGEHVVISFDLVKPKDLLDNVEELTSILLLFQRISLYKKSTSFNDDVKDLIPLAIAETITDFDSNEKKISFIFSLLKYYRIQTNREEAKETPQLKTKKEETKEKPQLKSIITTKILEFFTHEEIFEALVLAIEYKRGGEDKNYILKGMMEGIRHNFGSIDEIIKEYININPASFQEAMLKIGFIKSTG